MAPCVRMECVYHKQISTFEEIISFSKVGDKTIPETHEWLIPFSQTEFQPKSHQQIQLGRSLHLTNGVLTDCAFMLKHSLVVIVRVNLQITTRLLPDLQFFFVS